MQQPAVTLMVKAARAAGKECGVLLRRTEDVASKREQGLSWIAVDSDLGILREQYTRIVKGATKPA